MGNGHATGNEADADAGEPFGAPISAVRNGRLTVIDIHDLEKRGHEY